MPYPMAHEDHLKILKLGVGAWNQWRKENPDIRPNLREVDLRGADLGGADLIGANLVEANLNGANLGRALLGGATLIAAKLIDASLNMAILRGANLSEANLRSADFRMANINSANLRSANLRWADLTNATVGFNVFGDVDLSEVRGLETVKHLGPSVIGIDAIYRSQGKIPEIFLDRAGVPEPFIVNIKSLVAAMSPIEFYSCFISYSTKDQEFAERLYADLQTEGVRCWFAPEDLRIGDRFRQSIDEAIRRYDKLLVVLSETSVTSSWVESEVEAAMERESRVKGDVVLFPIRVDEAVMETDQSWAADIRRKRHVGDFSTWHDRNSYQKAFLRLLRDLRG